MHFTSTGIAVTDPAIEQIDDYFEMLTERYEKKHEKEILHAHSRIERHPDFIFIPTTATFGRLTS